ncbi:hypothetical protein [Pandoravirus japonicus]|uniref:Uncharacterized protein n=1 Tax=Pandoravirus japonicus TaxID=2823154 RepID=A0A811BRI6_9VIRU|nr:hypothetical protein [Pandoravirus japonicus]
MSSIPRPDSALGCRRRCLWRRGLDVGRALMRALWERAGAARAVRGHLSGRAVKGAQTPAPACVLAASRADLRTSVAMIFWSVLLFLFGPRERPFFLPSFFFPMCGAPLVAPPAVPRGGAHFFASHAVARPAPPHPKYTLNKQNRPFILW